MELIDGYYFLALKSVGVVAWLSLSQKKIHLDYLRGELLKYILPVKMIDLYKVREADLILRLNCIDWVRLQQFSGAFKASLDWTHAKESVLRITKIIEALPRQLYLPKLTNRAMYISQEKLFIADMSDWSWEPCGVGWPLSKLNELPRVLGSVAVSRKELHSVRVREVRLVARLYELEKRYSNKNYLGTVNVLLNLLKDFEDVS